MTEPLLVFFHFTREAVTIWLLLTGSVALLTSSFAWLTWAFLALRAGSTDV